MSKLYLFLFVLISGFLTAPNLLAKEKIVVLTQKELKTDKSQLKNKQFQVNFQAKYKSKEFQYEVKVVESNFWDRLKEWIYNWLEKLFGLSRITSMKTIGIVVRVVAALIVLYVVYLIVKLLINKEGQWFIGKSTTKNIISYQDIEKDLTKVDFEKLINSTLKSGNKRLAIRYYYLWLLKKMAEKNHIDWNPEKTNSDYLYEIQNRDLKQRFGYASYLFNYIWYGGFDLEEIDFTSAQNTFKTTIASI
jgi:hypothetical protein